MEELGLGLVYYAVFVFSVTLHEAGHAWAARRGGDPTAYHGGQVSIDPRPHMRREPFGMVVVPLIGVALSGWPFGWASTPFDPDWARAHPHRAAWMSLAGPAANLALLLAAAVLVHVGLALGTFSAPYSIEFSRITSGEGPVAEALALGTSVLFSMNLVLLLLNLIPLPPLDGSGVVMLFFPEDRAGRIQDAIRQPVFALLGLVLVFGFFGELFHPVFLFAVNLLYPGVHYG